MRDVGQNLGIPLYVFGPETHMTAIVGMALGKKPIPKETEVEFATANFLLPGGQSKVGIWFVFILLGLFKLIQVKLDFNL
jgi:ATP citrate (pro-S)-lyase